MTKRTAKTAFVVVAAMILLQFYWVRELVFAEAAFALVFVVIGLIAVYAAGWFAVLRLWKLGVGALVSVSVRQRQPFAKATITGLSEAKEEVS